MNNETPPPGDLTKLMLFFGRVPETHIKSLEGYPFMFFNEVEAAGLNYSVATKNNEDTIFIYDLLLNPEANDHLDKRYKALESAIRSLFWKEAKVQVQINGKEVYKSE
jgi:hypothetical protein